MIKPGPHRIFYHDRYQTVSIERINYDRWRVIFDDKGVELWSDHDVRSRVESTPTTVPTSPNTEPPTTGPDKVITEGLWTVNHRGIKQEVSVRKRGRPTRRLWHITFSNTVVELWSDTQMKMRSIERIGDILAYTDILGTELPALEPPSKVCPKCTSINTFLWDEKCSIHKCNACRHVWPPEEDDWFARSDAEFTKWLHNASRGELMECLKKVREEKQCNEC